MPCLAESRCHETLSHPVQDLRAHRLGQAQYASVQRNEKLRSRGLHGSVIVDEGLVPDMGMFTRFENAATIGVAATSPSCDIHYEYAGRVFRRVRNDNPQMTRYPLYFKIEEGIPRLKVQSRQRPAKSEEK